MVHAYKIMITIKSRLRGKPRLITVVIRQQDEQGFQATSLLLAANCWFRKTVVRA